MKMLLFLATLRMVSMGWAENDTRATPPPQWHPNGLMPDGYDKMKVPKVDGRPVVVEITVNMTQILEVNESDQSFTIDILFKETWGEPRLTFPPKSDSKITIGSSFQTKLWIPDLYFTNSLPANNVQPSALYFELDSVNNTVSMFSRLILKLKCDMEFFYFPQDTQECSVDLSSFTVRKSDMRLVWQTFTYDLLKRFPKFEVPRFTNSSCTAVRGPDFPCVSFRLFMFRRICYYIIRIYCPSFLLVITCFVGFWMPLTGYPARLALVVTPLIHLSLITQETQVKVEINVSYVVALHIWMIASTFFVFMSLIEYGLGVIYCHRIENRNLAKIENNGFAVKPQPSRASHWIKVILIKVYGDIDYLKAPRDRNKVDYCARIIFPAAYLIFILIYVVVFVLPWLAFKYNW